LKLVLDWVALLACAIALGLALAAAQSTFGISRTLMQGAIVVLLGAGLVAALVVGWRLLREVANEDDRD